MSMTLRIFGIRKLNGLEIAELTGKTYREICESQFFRTLFPSASDTAGYRFYNDSHGTMKSIAHMTVPVAAAEDQVEYGERSYVYWEEELGYYWRNLSHDDPRIDEILTAVGDDMHYSQEYSVVPYEAVGSYMNRSQPTGGEDEIIAVSYG